jgi:hypothetical protein
MATTDKGLIMTTLDTLRNLLQPQLAAAAKAYRGLVHTIDSKEKVDPQHITDVLAKVGKTSENLAEDVKALHDVRQWQQDLEVLPSHKELWAKEEQALAPFTPDAIRARREAEMELERALWLVRDDRMRRIILERNIEDAKTQRPELFA